MTTPLRLVRQALIENGFDDPAVEVGLSEKSNAVLIKWSGHGVWSFDAGMMRSGVGAVAIVAITAQGRQLSRVLLDLADDEYEPFAQGRSLQ